MDQKFVFRFLTTQFRTSLLGDFTIGPWNGTSETHAFSISRKSTLIHTASDLDPDDPAVSFSHVFPRSNRCLDFSPLTPQTLSFPGSHDPCFSSAPLAFVCYVWIYRDSGSGSAKGFIIFYRGGAQRALGSCRVGIDPVDKCETLADIRFRSSATILESGTELPGVDVQICAASDNDEDDAGWTRLKEGMTLEMWFDDRRVVLDQVPSQSPHQEAF
jgi:hypothetical protein